MKKEIKRNHAFIENTTNNIDLIKKSVNEMEKENVNPQPHNFISVNSANTYPEDLHDAFELPGEYEQIENPYAYTYDGKDKYMNYVESVGPDGDVIIQSIAFLDANYATNFLKESVELFTSLENIDNSFLLFLHLSHKVMIKNFIKDKDERRRLLTIITKSLKK